jgi:predicted PurR-regulated permease PerM
MEQDKTNQRKATVLAISIYAVFFLLLLLITNITHFNQWIGAALDLLRPVLIGLVIAYLCNPFFRLYERKMFVKIHPHGLRRTISLIFTYLTLFAIVGVLIMLIVPQLVSSITDFVANSDELLVKLGTSANNLIEKANSILPRHEDGSGMIPLIRPDALGESVSGLLDKMLVDSDRFLQLINADTLGSLIKLAGGLVSLIGDVLIGFFISLYLLNTKEKRYAQIMRLRRAALSEQVNNVITKICTTADKSFGGFLKGKLLDSCMVGFLVYVANAIIGVPYAILIAVIVAITDIVPIIGPFIGVIPSAVIILLTDHTKVIPFLLCILIIQQIDGNILAPKILGENTGVSSLCVMIAITTLGSLWGLAGMVLGVPLFATVLELSGDWLDSRLKKKGLSTATEDYYVPELLGEESKPDKTVFEKMQERIALRRQITVEGGNGELNTLEHFRLETYELAKKHDLFSKEDDASLLEFAAEEAALAEETEVLLEELARGEELAPEPLAEETAETEAPNETDAPNEADSATGDKLPEIE